MPRQAVCTTPPPQHKFHVGPCHRVLYLPRNNTPEGSVHRPTLPISHHARLRLVLSLSFCSLPSQNLSPLYPKPHLGPASQRDCPLRSKDGDRLRIKNGYMLTG